MFDVAYFAGLLDQVHELSFHVQSREEHRAVQNIQHAMGRHFPERYVGLDYDKIPGTYLLYLTDICPGDPIGEHLDELPMLLAEVFRGGLSIPRTDSGANLDALRYCCTILKERCGIVTRRVTGPTGTTVTLDYIAQGDWEEEVALFGDDLDDFFRWDNEVTP